MIILNYMKTTTQINQERERETETETERQRQRERERERETQDSNGLFDLSECSYQHTQNGTQK